MTDAPKRIWATPDDSLCRDEWKMGWWNGQPGDKPGRVEYHLARPGQPCSTDEFLGRVSAGWVAGKFGEQSELMLLRIGAWMAGDFTAAMDGLE